MTPIRRARWFMAAALVVSAGCHEYDANIEPTPIQYDVLAVGHGKAAKAGNLVRVRYRIDLPNGDPVLQDDDTAFELGAGAVIAGMDEAVKGMKVGEKRRVDCPPHWHWGRAGYGGKIPPNTNLTIHVTLLEIR